jgi:hypothetical protein
VTTSFVRPERAFTGRGYHILFAYPRITIPGVPEQYRQRLAPLECRVDSTFELRRRVCVYGTSKLAVGIAELLPG